MLNEKSENLDIVSLLLISLILLMAFEAFFAIPFTVIQALSPPDTSKLKAYFGDVPTDLIPYVRGKVGILGSTASLAFSLLIFYFLKNYSIQFFVPIIHRISRPLTHIKGGYLIFLSLLLGFILRTCWIYFFPAKPASDGAIYMNLAQRMANGEQYTIASTYAYWPPGYPIFLSFFFKIFGSNIKTIKLINISIYFLTFLIIYLLAKKIIGRKGAIIATLMLSIYPTHIALTGLPSKELLLCLILSSILLLHAYTLTIMSTKMRLVSYMALGLLVGSASLIQPACLLLIIVLTFSSYLSKTSSKSILLMSFLIILGMITIIIPWSIRNYKIFNSFVLISTNGGSNFYRANNPIATGKFMPRGAIDLSNLDELEQNEIGYRYALKWITDHPIDFIKLSFNKQIIFLGDDSGGIYASLHRGSLNISSMTYYIFKGLSNFYWLLIWIAITIALLLILEKKSKICLFYLYSLILIILYFFFIHSIFESSPKYHEPLIGLFRILASFVFNTVQSQDTESI